MSAPKCLPLPCMAAAGGVVTVITSPARAPRHLGDAALDYAVRHHFAVVPLHTIAADGGCTCEAGVACQHRGKHPRLLDWSRYASRTPATIRKWWAMWPEANVGIATGHRS